MDLDSSPMRMTYCPWSRHDEGFNHGDVFIFEIKRRDKSAKCKQKEKCCYFF